MFQLFLYEVKSDNHAYNWPIFFFAICFITFDFIVLSDLNSYPKNLFEILLINFF